MTEEEWMAEDAEPMLLFEHIQWIRSRRKHRLYSVAGGRELLSFLKSAYCMLAYDVVERQADGNATAEEIADLSNRWPDGELHADWNWNIGLGIDGYRQVALNVALDLGEDNPLAARALIRDIFGNPFRPIVADPAWVTPTVQSIASAIYADRAFDRLPILADALEEAGCTNADLLLHCRQPGEHVRGCWVVDLVLGKT
jgi:hypothetical protein